MLQRAASVHPVSARPSDAVALAVRYGAPIFAEEGVLDEAGRGRRDAEAACPTRSSSSSGSSSTA